MVGTAAAGLWSVLPRNASGAVTEKPACAKLRIAGIGIGGMGHSNLSNCANEDIVALCDVDHSYAAKAFRAFPNAKRYTDYRVMFEKQADIDAVVIATPDHTHAAITLAAIKLGKHVYCQKPLTHDVYEARMVAEAARDAGVVTQMGIQGHSQEGHRLICEWIWAGAIGAVREVDAWCSLSYAPHGHVWWSSPLSDRPAEGQPVPAGLDWNVWIGPAAMRPYHSCYHPKVWRCWWDFGCGMMGDRGAHTLDAVVSALKLTAPASIEGAAIVGGNAEVHPDKAVVTYRFPEREGFPALKLTWYEGQEPPRPAELEQGRALPAEGGVLFRGEKGTIMCGVYGDSPRLIPESAMKEYVRPAKTIPRITGTHEQDWISAIREGRKACADFSYSGPLTEIALLGNLAKRFPGRELKWDSRLMRVTNCEAANEWVRRPCRKDW